jgi:transcriptional regulator with XRE-family HTH domain
MVSSPTPAERRELAAFLKARRSALSPAALGLPAGSRRRTPGLRREEVAQRAGISLPWYTWLEQARPVSASAPALARLADALCLSRAERAYLFALAGRRDPAGSEAAPLPDLPAPLADIPAAISVPAYLLDRTWTARAWNEAAARLFVGWLDRPAPRNLLRYIFLAPEARALVQPWDERARRVVAEFRADCGRALADPVLSALVEDLARVSPVFARLWDDRGVIGREGGLRRFDHPQDGRLIYNQTTFSLAEHPDCKLVILTPAA